MPNGLRRARLSLAAGAVLAACACTADEPRTEVRVVLDAEPALLAQARELRIAIVGPGGDRETPGPFELATVPLPAELALVPVGGDANRAYEVTAELIDATGATIAAQRARSRYVAGELREIRLLFDGACTGLLCGDGESCFEGECVDACIEPTPRGEVTRSVFVSCGGMPGCPMEGLPRCDGDVLQRCGVEPETCALGCSTEGGVHCRALVPSNVAPDRVDLDASAADVRVPAGETWVIDTDAGSIAVHEGDPTGDPVRQIDLDAQGIVYRVVPQDGGASLGVFAVGRLTIAEGARVVSIGDLPLVLLAGTEAVIEGELSVAANEVTGDQPGAGGYRGAPAQGSFETMPGEGPGGGGTGEKLHGTETFVDAGGGGGSFGGPGGAGGAGEGSSETSAGGAPGPVDPDRTLDPLTGGSGGGAGAGNPGGAGGHGGGALQLSARDRVRVAPTGSVNAGGGGGRSPAMRSAGGGGGSGGAILLEAPVVEILGSVAAMGGGGGQGGADVASDHGENGRTDGVPARGGDNGMCCGPGGAGSDPVFGAATDGRDAQNAGGGGGGGGRVRILTATGTETYSGVYPDEERGPSSVAPITSAR